MTSMDRTLLERWIARRDAEAFSEIVSRYADLVYGVSKRVLRNDADAEDITQNCFLQLARTASPPRSSILGWLHAVATRSSIDLLRARKRRREREHLFARKRAKERSAEPTMQEIQEHVDGCIARLPDELRSVIIAHFLERKTQDTVAAALGVSRQTVGHRIQEGIERLRFLLKKRGVAISGAVLTSCLGHTSVEAAPAALLASLGRLALAGPAAVATTEPAAALILIAKVGGFIMAKKLLISGILAAALILISGWVVLRPLLGPAGSRSSSPGADRASRGDGPVAPKEPRAARRAVSERAEVAAGDPADALHRDAIAGNVVDVEGRPVGGRRGRLGAVYDHDQ